VRACHGDLLAGGESAPPLTGGAFLANWNGLTIGDLFDRISQDHAAERSGPPHPATKRGHSGLHAERQQVSGWQNGNFTASRRCSKRFVFEARRPAPKK